MRQRGFAAVVATLTLAAMAVVMFCVVEETPLSGARPVWAAPLQDAPLVDHVDPASAPNNLDTTVIISGFGFVATPSVFLGDTPLTEVVWQSPTQLQAQVPWGLEPGAYTLTVENPDGTTGSRIEAFAVTQGMGIWTTDGPYGGSVHHLEMDGIMSSTLYASLGLAGADGFFKSPDEGRHWTNSFPGLISTRTPLAGFALKPGAPGTIYLSGRADTGDSLFRSTDEGQTWETIWLGGSGFFAIAASAGNPGYLYMGNGDLLLRSTDGGDQWASANRGIPTDASISILAVHPVTPTIVYAAVEPGLVFKTVDAGDHWTQVANLGEGWWSALKIDPHAPERIYASGWHTGHFFARSLDGGETWQAMTLDVDHPSANDIEFHPTVSGTLYAIAPEVFRSTDAGQTWEMVPVPENASEGWSLVLHPKTGLPALIGHNGRGVLASSDGGTTWEERNQGLAGLRPHEIAASPVDPRYLYVAADEAGGFSSNDGGQSWLAAGGEDLDRGISVAAHLYSPTIAYLGARRTVHKTTDGGQTWTRHELPGLPPNNEMRVHAIAIDPNDPRVMYAGPGTWDFSGGPEVGWVYRSLDAGETWQMITTTLPISAVTDIEIDPTNSQILYVATGRRFLDSTDRGSGILKSTDGGQSWSFVNEGLTARSISRLAINPQNPQVVYAGAVLEGDSAYSGVYKTTNGGESWQQMLGGVRVSGLALDPVVTDTVYIGAYMNGVHVSRDGGVTWEREAGPLGVLPIESLHVTTPPSRTLVLAGVAGNLLADAPALAADSAPALSTQPEFYGGGVYQITIDRRAGPARLYLPFIVRQ